jgi:hypothetical protein
MALAWVRQAIWVAKAPSAVWMTVATTTITTTTGRQANTKHCEVTSLEKGWSPRTPRKAMLGLANR